MMSSTSKSSLLTINYSSASFILCRNRKVMNRFIYWVNPMTHSYINPIFSDFYWKLSWLVLEKKNIMRTTSIIWQIATWAIQLTIETQIRLYTYWLSSRLNFICFCWWYWQHKKKHWISQRYIVQFWGWLYQQYSSYAND